MMLWPRRWNRLRFVKWHSFQFHNHPQCHQEHKNGGEKMQIVTPLYNFCDLCGAVGEILHGTVGFTTFRVSVAVNRADKQMEEEEEEELIHKMALSLLGRNAEASVAQPVTASWLQPQPQLGCAVSAPLARGPPEKSGQSAEPARKKSKEPVCKL